MKSSHHFDRNTRSFVARPILWSVAFLMAAAIVFGYKQTAHAGLFSFLSDLVSADQASADIRISESGSSTGGSQNMPLLQAASNLNPNSNNCADTPPINGSILDPSISSGTIGCSASNVQINTYVVVAGDTISSVAKMFNVSVNTILWANDLTSRSVLQPGQNLVILPVDGIPYVIKKGDSLENIAKRYGGSHASDVLMDILNYNDLTLSSTITVGQKIIIPAAEPLANETGSYSSSGSWSPKCISTYERLIDNISNLRYYPEYYIRPVAGGYKSQCLHGHNAVDFAAPVDTPIKAAAGGVVIISMMNGGWNGGYGNYVVIKHANGSQTLYSHMNSASKGLTKIGQQVNRGDTIGYIGMTGLTTGPHVHFEIRGAQNPF